MYHIVPLWHPRPFLAYLFSFKLPCPERRISSAHTLFLWPPHNKQGWFTLVCLLNRYLPVFGYLPFVVSYFFPASFPVCHGLQVYHGIFVMALQVLAGTLCLIRVYALYGRSRRVLGLLLVVGSGSIIHAALMLAAGVRSRGGTVPVMSSLHECIQFSLLLGGLYDSLAWIGVLVFDSVIISLTLYKAVTIGRNIPLLGVIVRDGTMSFSVLFIVNLVNILMLRFFPPSLKHCTATLTNVLSTILSTRLVLNLREQNSALAGLSTTVGTEWRFQAAPLAATPMTSLESVRVTSSEPRSQPWERRTRKDLYHAGVTDNEVETKHASKVEAITFHVSTLI
ncbi:hypothetical protein BJV78DRAFT_278255 [Lactifluus subvellereus]|nr:hypothetical protein BJV78DRAFT_278255 [Lactifluus subvellereus]